MLLWPKSGTGLFERSPRAQDAIGLAGWIGSRSVAIIVRKYHTYISDHVHQVVAGSDGNTIDSSSTSYGDKRGVHQRFGSPQTQQYQSVEHSLQLMENTTTYATHTEIVAANQLVIVQHPRATGIGWSTLSITKWKHM